jgi:hypothetical protein
MKNEDSEEILFEITEPVRLDYVPEDEIVEPLPEKHDQETGS